MAEQPQATTLPKDDQALDLVARFMVEHWHLITQDESEYKTAYVQRITDAVASADLGASGWDLVFRADVKTATNLLGWRLLDDAVRLARSHPAALRSAAAQLRDDSDVDAFWGAIAAHVPEARLAEFVQLRGVGARATVASYFLFIRDPYMWPILRKSNFGQPLARMMHEPLDARSPEAMLLDYYRKLDTLAERLRERGVAVRSRLDVQGVLWVVNYKKLLA
jgi:hypothetical protein